MANEITSNLGIELPTPGVTGALGVEAPGASWMELQNEGFRKVDAHDHGLAGGAPLNQDSIIITDDFSFQGFSAIALKSTRFSYQTAALAGVNDRYCAYFINGNFWINNDAGTPVQITNGSTVAGAAGNITGLAAPAALSWQVALQIFRFEASSGVKAGIQVGPISIYEPVSGGKKVTIAVPGGLAADYALTLPPSLPGTTKLLAVDASGAITATTDPATLTVGADGVSLQLVGAIFSVKDLGISTAKIADLAVTAAKLAGGIPKSKIAAPVSAVSISSGSFSTVGAGSVTVTGAGSAVCTATLTGLTSGRPVVVQVQPSPGTLGIVASSGGGDVNLEIVRDGSTVAYFNAPAPATGEASLDLPSFIDFGATLASHAYTMKVGTSSGTAAVATDITIAAYEL